LSVVDEISNSIAGGIADLNVSAKAGKSLLQPTVASALRSAGFRADEEDSGQLLRSGMPVWRSKDNNAVVPTKGRRRVDIVVYKNGDLVALIETESDLNDLRSDGVTKRNGHYDVASIAKAKDGTYFNSYNSIERMASAAFYWNAFRSTGRYPSPRDAVIMLEAVRSDDSRNHNPAQIPLFLVSGFCRRQDPAILSRRLESLGAKLICAHNA
jgi:hypothetical protein